MPQWRDAVGRVVDSPSGGDPGPVASTRGTVGRPYRCSRGIEGRTLGDGNGVKSVAKYPIEHSLHTPQIPPLFGQNGLAPRGGQNFRLKIDDWRMVNENPSLSPFT
jgi:hypothetical protein